MGPKKKTIVGLLLFSPLWLHTLHSDMPATHLILLRKKCYENTRSVSKIHEVIVTFFRENLKLFTFDKTNFKIVNTYRSFMLQENNYFQEKLGLMQIVEFLAECKKSIFVESLQPALHHRQLFS